ncbi:MAG: phytanoyl-CoA dioxygenase family protein [Bacteroidota bacterium]
MRFPLLNIFSSKKMIRNTILNRIGIQLFRVWLADKRYKIRSKHLKDSIRQYIEELDREGIVVIPDFLPSNEFAQLEKECLHALENVELSRIREDGPNQYTNIGIEKLEEYNGIKKTFDNEMIADLFSAAERRKVNMQKTVRLLSCLIQGKDNGTMDPETALHEDTFFNTHKAWLYISDVDYPNAPFVYVKGSNKHHKTDRYRKTYKYSLSKDSIHSRRISQEELNELNLKETHFVAKKNTFVIANTLGFHRRLRGEEGNRRVALAFSVRHNPFI